MDFSWLESILSPLKVSFPFLVTIAVLVLLALGFVLGKLSQKLAFSKQIKDEAPLTTKSLDTGFRVFKVDEGNMNDVYYSAGEYTQDLLSMMESNVKSDRTDLDLLFGCLLEWGLPLSMPYYSEKLEGCTVHTYNDGDLIACFDENIPDSVIKAIAKRQPLRAVFRDSSFTEAANKMNLFELFKQKCSWTDEEVKKNVRVI